MRTELIFDGNDDLLEYIDDELSNSNIMLTHQPGELRVYFDTPSKHTKYGGIFVSFKIDSPELIKKLQDCINTPGEVTLLERTSPHRTPDNHESNPYESLPITSHPDEPQAS